VQREEAKQLRFASQVLVPVVGFDSVE
jgi:hypothetical protein